MNTNRQRAKYIVSDFITGSVAWALFNLLRYHVIASYLGYTSLLNYLSHTRVWEGQLFVPVCWVILYYFTGYYNKPFGKSRVAEFFTTVLSVLIGGIVIFFVVVLDDLPSSFTIYYQQFFALIGLQFLFTYIPRLIITNQGRKKIRSHQWASHVLILGTGKKAVEMADCLFKQGYSINGFLSTEKEPAEEIPSGKLLGTIDDLPEIMLHCKTDEFIVVTDNALNELYPEVLNRLYQYRLPIKVYADKLKFLPKIKTKNIYGLPLIDVTDNQFSEAEKNIKYFIDKIVAAICLVLLFPLFLYIVRRIKKDSPGPVLFRQERIGAGGRPFVMYKFRTMYVDAEGKGPMLSSENDTRITPFGKYMRKYRLDELPQFWNVLKGDMSLVGPRPERQYFIDRITEKAPYYFLLQRLRPGITSWGMVKFGYAETVEKMIERLDYDMLYYGHMSLLTDIKILLFTIKTVATGRGI